MEPVTIDDFHKVEIRIGEVMSAERIEGSDKLLKLLVNFGAPSAAEAKEGKEDVRQVLSGIAKYFSEPAVLVGKRCPFVTNLPARSMMGLESHAMLLAVGGEGTPFALFETQGTPGDRIK